MNTLKGANLAGTSTTRERIKDDFYATPETSTRAILDKEVLEGSIYEPAAGQGHIIKVLKEYYPDSEIFATDLVDRGDPFNLGIVGNIDFLEKEYKQGEFDNIITNPPFNMAQAFIEKALTIATKKVIMFAKIQLLEGTERRKMFDKFPPKTIYVFTKRQNPMRNGSSVDEKGKPWASTMCFAWFVWEKGYKGKPSIEWL